MLCCHGSPARPRGYVLEISAAEGDDGAPGATARTLFVAGAPSEGGQYGRDATADGLPPGSAWPENPAVVAVDGRGRAWIGTDRAGLVGAHPDYWGFVQELTSVADFVTDVVAKMKSPR